MSEKFDVEKHVSIQNIVGSGKLPVEVKTEVLGDDLDEASMDESYTWMDDGPQPGLYYEVGGDDGPQVTFHESGSYIVRADSEDELYETNNKVIGELKDLGVIDEDTDMDDLEFTIQNVVALAEIDEEIQLRALHMGLGTDAQYEPEVFPALEYSTSNYPCSFLVYGNGKIIVAGASSVDEVKESMSDFYDEIAEAYLDVK